MTRPFTVEPALPADRPDAFRLLFQHVPAREREGRTAVALEMLAKGEVDPAGLLAARRGPALLGAMLCMPVAGAGGLVWPPQAVRAPDGAAVEDALVREGLAWLGGRGAKLAQALLRPEEDPFGAALQRNGFRRVTRLLYLRHFLDLPFSQLVDDGRVEYRTYDRDPDLFHQTLLRTYEGTLDCPEVNGVRTIGEIIDGHRHQGRHDPARWWLSLVGGRPAGVLLLADVPDWRAWDVCYLGVVPEARGRGIGTALTRKALFEARAAEAGQLTLSVDARNQPARGLYARQGFEEHEQREVYLALLCRNEEGRSSEG